MKERSVSRRLGPYSVGDGETPVLKRLNLPYLERTTSARGGKERFPLAGNQRIDHEPQFIYQPGLDEAVQ